MGVQKLPEARIEPPMIDPEARSTDEFNQVVGLNPAADQSAFQSSGQRKKMVTTLDLRVVDTQTIPAQPVSKEDLF